MTDAAIYLPAWLLQYLPVWLARQCSQAKWPQTQRKNFTREKQLLVDVSVVHQNDARTGIQRVVRALLIQLLATPPHGYNVRPVFATRQQQYAYAEPNFLNKSKKTQSTRKIAQPEIVQVGSSDLFLALDLAAHILHHHKNQVLQWKRQGVQIHVVVYDLLPLQHPEWFNPKTTRNFKRWLAWLIVYADSAICISNTIKIELQNLINTHLGIHTNKLPVSTFILGANINETAPTEGLPPNADFLLKTATTKPAILMVGTLEPRKGYDQALAAFEIIWANDSEAPLLIIVGRPGWKTEDLQHTLRKHPQAGKRLFWLEDVSDEFLELLYSACRGVLVASLAEGFGLPLVEAALKNKPVLARNLSVFKELPISGVDFFTANTADGLAIELKTWIDNISKKPFQTSEYIPTWQQSSIQLMIALGINYNNSPKLHFLDDQKNGVTI
ncbi:MAG: glycosyltransferase family 4 protein [Polaromonas sp.]